MSELSHRVEAFLPQTSFTFRTIEALAQGLGTDVPTARLATAESGARPTLVNGRELWTLPAGVTAPDNVKALFSHRRYKFRTIEAAARALGLPSVSEARIVLANVGARPSKRGRKELWTRHKLV